MPEVKANPDENLPSVRFSTNNGHDQAYLARALDPEGAIVEHRIVTTGRQIDFLFEHRTINPDQHQAATMLRDDFERSRLSMGALPAVDPERPYVSGARPDGGGIANEAAWRRYQHALKQIGEHKRIVRFVVIEDASPLDYGQRMRCDGRLLLQSGLDALVRHYGLLARGRRRFEPVHDEEEVADEA